MSLPTPSKVEKPKTSLQTKAKTEPAFRFYSLWDKVCRRDVLAEAWRCCRANAGAAGVDGETFEQIESQGIDGWLETLREELRSGQYVPQPLLRVWIPKSNGGQRPLGIPTIRDRVAQMAVVLIIGPIFEADLLPEQYGFRPAMDAKSAVRRVYWHITQSGRREVADADLRDYFTSIPHSPLMRSLARRIAERSTDFGMPALHITAAEIEDRILGIARHNLVVAAPIEGGGEGCRKFFGFCCQWTCCHTLLHSLVRTV